MDGWMDGTKTVHICICIRTCYIKPLSIYIYKYIHVHSRERDIYIYICKYIYIYIYIYICLSIYLLTTYCSSLFLDLLIYRLIHLNAQIHITRIHIWTWTYTVASRRRHILGCRTVLDTLE